MSGIGSGGRANAAPPEYIPFADARRDQAERLRELIAVFSQRIALGELAIPDSDDEDGPGPILVGIGASLAAACAPVWALRERGILAWRLGSGDAPLPFPPSHHRVIGISQSGRSSETLAALRSVDESLRDAVVNMASSPIADLVGPRTMALGSIPDSYASTIGYTATTAVLGMVADAWNGRGIDAGWITLADEFEAVVDGLTTSVADALNAFEGASWADVIGSGPASGSAEAGALLLREVARVPATAMGTRQYLHGAMESAGGGVHVILGDRRELSLAATLLDAGHRVVLVTSEVVAHRPNLHVLRVPERPAAQRAIIEAGVLQGLAEGVARRRGIEIEEFVFHNDDTKVATGD
ncbi:hypothetical protein GCM10009775_29390 [Microbacterium aoyamense]|uniref:Glutamine--fructose-6-phosphate aminotransferase [isomerizing] n=1 Tax=Microbacterium aoyamense TaxID=344166 RepID=A0ABN2PW14_9MICO|nr:SIS domain-containing protein [Microbacterium aoyamense]